MGVVENSNYQKFQTQNPMVRRLIERFYRRLMDTVEPLKASSLLDAGCGEGETLARLGSALPPTTAAVDVSSEAVAFTRGRFPEVQVSCHSIDELPFGDDSFDLVLCLEVLEHISNPAPVAAELARVAHGQVMISVPHEPWFRAGSLLRGKYARTLGNHPEHVNHWNRGSLRRFLEPHFEVVSVRGSFPWLIAACRPRR